MDLDEYDVVVAELSALAEGVVGVWLARADGEALPSWSPGAHIDLLLPGFDPRQYSLCGDPGDRHHWQVAVLREPEGRGGSAYVHDQLKAGDRIRIRGPLNNFELLPAQRYAFIAGGIGITPLLPMIREAEQQGMPWRLLYGGRTRASMAFTDELAAYGERVTIAPQDEAGLLDVAGWLGAADTGTLVYCCGPEPLLRAVETVCGEWHDGALRTERFRGVEIDTSHDEAFKVELALSGVTLEVPAGKSILDVIEEAGVPVLWSCREGTCGTCETVLLEGVADHRDTLLTPEEREQNDLIYPCVSRARSSRLVLEL